MPDGTVTLVVIGSDGVGPLFVGSVVAVPPSGNVSLAVCGGGAPVCGVTASDGSDAGPVPTSLVAVTVNV